MEQTKENVFAVVVGDWHFNALGMIRSLGEQGVRVYYLNMSNGGYGEDSVYTIKSLRYHDAESLCAGIAEIFAGEQGTGYLFPSGDMAAYLLDSCRGRFPENCVCPGADGNLLNLMKKHIMCQYAEEAGFKVPATKHFPSKETFSQLASFPLPIIVKPTSGVDTSKADIRVCRTAEDVQEAISFFENDERYTEILAQEFVHGETNHNIGYGGCKVPGKKVMVFGQLEKIREYPLDRGSTTYAVIRSDITYMDVDVLDAFLEKTGFDGLFDLDIKLVDGVPYFIEINYRNGAPSYAYTVGGMNIPFTWLQLKQGITPDIQFHEVRLMSERDDLNHVKDKNIGVFSWFHDIRKTDAMMLYNAKDPKPFAQAYGKIATAVISKLVK